MKLSLNFTYLPQNIDLLTLPILDTANIKETIITHNILNYYIDNQNVGLHFRNRNMDYKRRTLTEGQ